MDNLLLQASVCELRREASGHPFHRLIPHGPEALTLLLGCGWGEGERSGARLRLHLSLAPELPLLHLTRLRTGHAATPTPFQALVARELEGTALAAIHKPTWERVVTFDFQVEAPAGPRRRRLVVELLGRRCNLLLLEGGGKLLGHARPAAGSRGLRVGEPYVPPGPGRRLDPEAVDEAAFRSLVADGDNLAPTLGRGLQGQSPPLCAEIERRAGAGEDPWALFRDLTGRVLSGRFEPCLYVSEESARILRRGELPEEPLAGTELVVTALPVEPPTGCAEVRYPGPGEALQAYRALRLASAELEARRGSLSGTLERERTRLERLAGRLEADLARSDREADLQRRGEILLAGMAGAQPDGDQVILPDPYGAEGATVTVELDPRRSLPENAERYFRLARKARRGRVTVGRRLAEVRQRLPRLEEAAGRLERASTARQVEELEELLAAEGLVRVVRRQRTRRQAAPPGSAPEILPVRSYVSADGLEVLMGRTGKENDLVTFKVAAPHDFWFHAQGFAGAHVVVRNPSRLRQLPESTARQAAMLAAFHSKARGSARVDVIFTQRRHVRKGKNLPPGKVLVRKHETLQVPPEMPFGDQEI